MSCNCKGAYMGMEMSESELMMQICQVQFVCVELNLYLDTHPDDEAAMKDYLAYAKQLKELIEIYEMEYGPLKNFGHSDTDVGSWVYSQWPWE